MTRYSHYILRHNPTRQEYVEPFTTYHAASVDEPPEAITEDGGLPDDKARRLISIWNRSQIHHEQEFTYWLVAKEAQV
jgi:hypothetical protein